MTRIRKSRFAIALMTLVLALSVLFGVMVLRDKKSIEANAAETVSVTQVQFRTNDQGAWFFLRMAGQTDYTITNQSHNANELTGNVLDNVTVYFLNGAYSLRDVWRGDIFGTYFWGDNDTLVFPMKAGFYANQGIGARIDAGTEIYMNSGENKVTATSRSFWNTGTSDNFVIENYTDGFNTIPTTLSKIHLRGENANDIHLMIGLGEGNDWDGKGEAISTQAQAADGTQTHANAHWMKLYLANFTSKIKLHVKETNTWVTYGSIIRRPADGAQWFLVYNGWAESGGIVRLKIDNDYNGTTIDKVLFEEGCELPSYAFNGGNIAHTVHVLDKAYLCENLNMGTAHWAVDWAFNTPCKVTFNGANDTYVKQGEKVPFPSAISETKPDDEHGSYSYNWFLNGEVYDFKTPVTENINLTSDGSFTLIPKMDSVIYLNEDGSVFETEQYPKDADISLIATPRKVGFKGVWKTLDGEKAPLVMPDGDVNLQVVYTKDFYAWQVEFRTSGEDAYFFLRFNDTDYSAGSKQQDPTFVTQTNLLDKVSVYFDSGVYSLRDIWDGTTLFTYLWGDDNTLAFKLVPGFAAIEGYGARIEEGAEIPLESGVLTLDTTRTFWQWIDRTTDFGIVQYIDGYKEIETTVDGVYFDERFIIDLGEGNDWAGHGEGLPTQAEDANGSMAWANNHWSVMNLANFPEKIKLHLQETDTWVTLGDAMALMGDQVGHPQWMYIYNGWNNVDGALRISVDYNVYNGMTVDRVTFEKGCELPSYDATAGIGYAVHVLTEEVSFCNNNTENTTALEWTKQYMVTFNGENGIYVDANSTVEYPTDLSVMKPATAEYTYVYNWFVNGEIYDFSTPITKCLDLTSDGTYTEIPNEYKVVYYAVDGSTVLYEDIFAYGKELTVRTAASIEGYVDCSWSYNGEGEIPTTMPAKDISFTVVGTPKTYTLTFGEEAITVTYAQALGQLPAVPEKAGYSGVWTVDGETLTADYIWRFDADKTAEVSYTANSYVLTFGENETMSVTYDEKIGQLPAVPEKEHYVGVWAVDGNELNADTVWTYASDMTAEVVYTPVNYTVTFDGENDVIYAYGSKIEKPADPVKESTVEYNYVFDAWYNGDVKWDFDNDVVDGDLDLVPKYNAEKRMYTVTFAIKGHTVTLEPVKVAYGDSLDLSNLFTEDQTAGYTYSVTVNGVEKASIKVVADVTVNVTFTEKADEPATDSDVDSDVDSATDSSAQSGVKGLLSKLGCSGVVGGLSAGLVILTVAGAALVCKRKED